MTVPAPQTPGVSIIELPSTSLTVQGSATAVPVFIGRFLNVDGTWATGGECIRIDSWLAFTKQFAESTVCSVSVPYAEPTSPPADQMIGHSKKIDRSTNTNLESVEAKQNKNVTLTSKSYIDAVAGSDIILNFSLSSPLDASDVGKVTCFAEDAGSDYAYSGANFDENASLYIDSYSASIPCTVKMGGGNATTLDLPEGTSSFFIAIKTISDSTVSKNLKLGFVLKKDASAIYYGYPFIWYRVRCTPTATLSLGSFAVMSHFQNGGGPCYVLPLSVGHEDELAALPAAIEEYPDITLLVCPETDETLAGLSDCTKSAVYSAINPLLTTDKGYFLIADAEIAGTTISAPVGLPSEYTAVYYPNLVTTLKRSRPADAQIEVTDYRSEITNLADLQAKNPSLYPIVNKLVDQFFATDYVTLPPSAAIAGAYARNDRERGVWKAPANIPLKGVRGLETVVSEIAQGPLNEQGINVIRWFSNRGPVIYGARTLAVTSEEWRYIPVRRLFNMAERDIKNSLSTLVFEPNNSMTWERARSAIYNYLAALWRQGALLGSTEKEAFFVQVGLGSTMTQEQIDAGQLIVKVGMAAVRPAEFIILQFTQDVQ